VEATSQLVPWNRWDVLDAPQLGEWTPTRRVSMVLPHYRAEAPLQLTLEAIAAQTYPADLLEVIVADDGSDVLPEVDADRYPFAVKVVTHERRGFGLARARNTGARAASGDILVFIDCDMVPERQHVEAHARWHHVHPRAVTLGRRWHVEFDGVTGDALRAAVEAGDVRSLFTDGREVVRPEWLERHFERTEELTTNHDDLFRTVTGGNMAMRADTYWSVGGSDETFTQWGAEDTELGYRLFVTGALLIADKQAMCWHQGEGNEPSASEQRSLEDQRAKLAHLIAHRGFRRNVAGRSYARPRVAVSVAGADAGRDQVLATVESLLAQDFHDLLVAVDLGDDHPDAVWLQRELDPDVRVAVDTAVDLDAVAPFTPIRVEVAAGTLLAPGAVAAIVVRLESVGEQAGVVHATVAGRRAGEVELRAALTRALRRGQDHLGQAAAKADVWRAAGDAFGEAWLAGSDLGLGTAEVAPRPVVEAGMRGVVAAADPSAPEVVEVWRLFSQLEASERTAAMGMARAVMARTSPRQRRLLLGLVRQLLAVVEAIAAIPRERTPRGLFRGAVRVLRALLPERAYAVLRAGWRGLRSR